MQLRRFLVARSWAGGPRVALVLALAVVVALVALLPGVGAASAAASHRVGGLFPARGSRLSLAQAPAGLRAAVKRTLGVRDGPAGSAFQQAKLTASNGASGDEFGSSVAVSGSTAVVGAPEKDSDTGAAYVFVRSGSAWSQQAELTAKDGAKGDEFGSSVAISGSTAVVGAPGKDSGTGAAYVFVRSGGAWSQQAKLTASGGAAGDGFGSSVAISGSTAVVGAPYKSSVTGAAYVFVQSGTTWSQQQELTASDGASGDQFGYSVAVSGETAVVGAYGHNSATGAAYVFVRSGSTWSQQQELTASDGASGDQFGFSVAVSGQTAVVGAPIKDSQMGVAYVFARSGTTWSQQAELTDPAVAAADDWFGWSVTVSGSTAVIGALGKNSETGAAYVFVRSGTSWPQRAELTASDGASGDEFGWSVAVSGSTAVVGARYENSDAGAAYVFVLPSQQAELTAPGGASGDEFGYSVAISGQTAVVGAPDGNSGAGVAYVFVRSGSTWSEQAKLTAKDGAKGDFFGSSVAISGSIAVVGAPYKSSDTGAAYVFVRSGSAWSQQAKLTAKGGASGDYFGTSVAVSGQTAVVGAYGNDSGTGAAYVFVRSGSTWSQQKELTAKDAAKDDAFGFSVAISGQTAVVGALGKNSYRGAAYVFVRSGSVWSQQAKLTAKDGASGDEFGYSVAISGQTAVVGAPYKNSDTGAAYVFARSGSTWSQHAKLTASDGARNDYFGTSVAISGQTAVIGALGNDSYTGAAYVFVGSGGAWSQQAELTASDAAAGDDFGDSVAISGQTAVVGAPYKEDSGAGAAYAFVNV